MNIEEKGQAAAIRRAGGRQLRFAAWGSSRDTLGADHVAWPAIAARHEVGHDGTVVIESFTPENQTIARATASRRPRASEQDAIAGGPGVPA